MDTLRETVLAKTAVPTAQVYVCQCAPQRLLYLLHKSMYVSDGNQSVLVNAMVSLDFVVFIGIVDFHIYQRVRNVKLWKEKILPKFPKFSQPKRGYDVDSEVTLSSPTITTVSLSQFLESMLEESN